CDDILAHRFKCCTAEKSDHWRRWQLRARRERPYCDRTAEKGDEPAPQHVPPETTGLCNLKSLPLCYGVASEKGSPIGPDPMCEMGRSRRPQWRTSVCQ